MQDSWLIFCIVFYYSSKFNLFIFVGNGKLEEFVSSWIYLMKEISSENAWFFTPQKNKIRENNIIINFL